MRFHAVLLTLALLAAPASAGDVVKLTTGQEYEGTIERDDDAGIALRMDGRVITIARKHVASVVRAERKPGSDVADREDDEIARLLREVQRSGGGRAIARAEAEKNGEPVDPELEDRLKALGSDDSKKRAEAAEWLTKSWPESKPLLDAAVERGTSAAQLEVSHLLTGRLPVDPTKYVFALVKSDAKNVRRAALRAARRALMVDIEDTAVELMNTDAEWAVRQEAIRTLQTIGGEQSIQSVITAWAHEPDKGRRRWYKRVLKERFGQDLGESEEAWQKALHEAFTGERQIFALDRATPVRIPAPAATASPDDGAAARTPRHDR